MGDDLRSGDITTAGHSVIAFAKYCEAVQAGDGRAQRLLDEIGGRNR